MAEELIVKYTRGVYEEKINRLEAQQTQLVNHLNNLENYRLQMRAFWQDDQGDNYGRVIEENIKKVTTALKQVTDLKEIFNQVVEGLEETQEEMNELVDVAMQAIGAILF